MDLVLCTVGKPRLPYASAGIAEYLKRLRRYGSVEWRVVKSGSREEENRSLLRTSEGCKRIALDRGGTPLSSQGIAGKLADFETAATRRLALLIGGADGFDTAFLSSCEGSWSFGPVTLQHELATVVLLEQLYRARTIQRGEPYHRE